MLLIFYLKMYSLLKTSLSVLIKISTSNSRLLTIIAAVELLNRPTFPSPLAIFYLAYILSMVSYDVLKFNYTTFLR